MTTGHQYHGLAVSEGVAIGEIYHADPPRGRTGAARPATAEQVRAAFATVARSRGALAAELRARGEQTPAGIVEVGALIAADPALITPVLDAMRGGADAVTAVRDAAGAQAALLAALPDADLAQRAADVRQIADAVLGELAGGDVPPPPASAFILVRREVDPADLIRLADGRQTGAGLAGAVSVGGGASSHAAIVARGLGLPMLAGADPRVLDAPAGTRAILDAEAGSVTVDPAATELAAATRPAAPAPPVAASGIQTLDGQRITVLCNVASAAETRLGLSGGAAGVGLLRTEIPFTGASAWPTESEHIAQLTPVLTELDGRPAVVRLLDFSGDKIPPFLASGPHGLTALLDAPHALDDQLRAILHAGRRARLAILVPMVRSLDEVRRVRGRLAEISRRAGRTPPELGIMVELASTASDARAFAAEAGFFSIGTNDLASDVLGMDRADPRTGPALAADPRVLTLIEHVVSAGRQAGISVSVCGDAAADPGVLPLLLRLGVRTISVGAARVPRVAGWIATASARS